VNLKEEEEEEEEEKKGRIRGGANWSGRSRSDLTITITSRTKRTTRTRTIAIMTEFRAVRRYTHDNDNTGPQEHLFYAPLRPSSISRRAENILLPLGPDATKADFLSATLSRDAPFAGYNRRIERVNNFVLHPLLLSYSPPTPTSTDR